MLTTGEIAQYCKVNFRTVIRWIKRGHLKAYQLPGRGDNRVEVDDFLRFLHQHNLPVPGAFQRPAPHAAPRVLIVDDDQGAARVIQRVLRRAGFETQMAFDGFSAGALMESLAPDVMTLDLRMPGLGGLEVLGFVRSHPRLQGTKILVVSGLPRARLDEALAKGADEVLGKPFENAALVEKVSRLAGVEVRALAEVETNEA
ncbi:MAG: response regulator [Candidatus Latescibacteria bacterium]|nr:response regulator [Candidatus Latescibacterota bacterium]